MFSILKRYMTVDIQPHKSCRSSKADLNHVTGEQTEQFKYGQSLQKIDIFYKSTNIKTNQYRAWPPRAPLHAKTLQRTEKVTRLVN